MDEFERDAQLVALETSTAGAQARVSELESQVDDLSKKVQNVRLVGEMALNKQRARHQTEKQVQEENWKVHMLEIESKVGWQSPLCYYC